jgi:hypothetical protein
MQMCKRVQARKQAAGARTHGLGVDVAARDGVQAVDLIQANLAPNQN